MSPQKCPKSLRKSAHDMLHSTASQQHKKTPPKENTICVLEEAFLVAGRRANLLSLIEDSKAHWLLLAGLWHIMKWRAYAAYACESVWVRMCVYTYMQRIFQNPLISSCWSVTHYQWRAYAACVCLSMCVRMCVYTYMQRIFQNPLVSSCWSVIYPQWRAAHMQRVSVCVRRCVRTHICNEYSESHWLLLASLRYIIAMMHICRVCVCRCVCVDVCICMHQIRATIRLQHTATHCNTLQRIRARKRSPPTAQPTAEEALVQKYRALLQKDRALLRKYGALLRTLKIETETVSLTHTHTSFLSAHVCSSLSLYAFVCVCVSIIYIMII